MAFNPYKAAKPYFVAGNAPAFVVSDEDKDRLQSYEFYENAFWNMPETFRVTQRGFDSLPIYLPSARKMVEAVNRFYAKRFNYLIENDQGNIITDLVLSMFKREKFFTKFTTQKRYSLIRGDALWHIVGDDTKPEGERLSIYELSPANYFPIMEGEKRVGCYLVEVIKDPFDPNGTKQVARVQTYRKDAERGTVTSTLEDYEVGKWDARNLKSKDIKLIRTVKPLTDLPAPISSIPVYVLPNLRIPGPSPFSYSEVLGVERVFAAVNQAISDEELALAMAGLGIFWTTSGPPRDGANRIVPWDIGPARMIEVGKDATLERLQGITSVDPMIDHMRFMLEQVQSGLSIPDIAAGKIEVDIAESGIALQLQLSPLLEHTAEKEGSLIEAHDQMFYDLVHGWLPAYEKTPAETETTMVAVTGDPMPRNRKADIDEIMSLVNAKIISVEEARHILIVEHGYKIAEGVTKLLEEQSARAQAEDPFAERANAELNGESGDAGQQNDDNAANGKVLQVTT